ncbi:substrate-binding domain-containing protein [Aeoliella sp. ICT_H6.2]|uniref:Substrate-binding domain-containing protein n=1 Tax=Aeoliella straminimaris TaxID=2954799 RepID=A0A9X2F8G6_9BACT|nr:substrate-binding domain-containing protein [Aeoliella straminimaris]MCO6044282.1 substrate-binding domain-containing protein [Aeoliella straminimaris]
MPETEAGRPKIIDLVDLLIADIQQRELKPGDRYLTTVDATRMLGVGSATANRALQILERRQIITRQQRRGAYIAQVPVEGSRLLRRVHFLVHKNYLTSEGVGNDFVLMGMQAELPGVDVRISHFPQDNVADFVQRLIDTSLTAKSKDGFVLVRAPYEAHQLINDCGVPALVYGCPYAGISRIKQVERDMRSIGEQSTRFLLDRGHRRIAWILRQQLMPGDHETLDAATSVLDSRAMPCSSVLFRSAPADSAVALKLVEDLLDMPDPPTGFVCRSQRFANAVATALERRNLRLYDSHDLVLCDYYLLPGHRPQYVFPRPVDDSETQGRYIARNLVALARGDEIDDVIIPVELDTSAARPRR